MILFIDVLLVLALLGLGGAAILSPDLLRSVILFMLFGFMMALTWARLHAPDVALTEAALGAGVTGALMLNALRNFRAPTGRDEGGEELPK